MKMISNKIILKQMLRLSRVITNLKEARVKMSAVYNQAEYFVCRGESLDTIQSAMTKNISNCLYLEQYLRSSVSKACERLDGFKIGKMDPVDFVSNNDVKNKEIDLCKGLNVVATIDLVTGEILPMKPELEMAEDKCPSEKS